MNFLCKSSRIPDLIMRCKSNWVSRDTCLHVVKDQVQIFVVFGFHYIQDLHDILVSIQLLQEHHLAESSLGIRRVVKCVKNLNRINRYFFQCHYFLLGPVHSFPHYSIRSLAKFLDDLIFFKHVRLYLLRHLFRFNISLWNLNFFLWNL